MASLVQLFELLQTLTKEEKRSFKLSPSYRAKPPQYMALFDALNQTVLLDEAAFKSRYAQSPWYKNLKNLKPMLYEQLLHFLRQKADTSQSAFLEVLKLLQTWDILLERGLKTQALQHLEKAEQLVEIASLPLFRPLLFSIRLRLALNEKPSEGSLAAIDNRLKTTENQINILLQQTEDFLRQYFLHLGLTHYHQLFNAHSTEIPAHFSGVMALLEKRVFADTGTQVLAYSNLKTYQRLLGQDVEHYDQKALSLLELHPNFIHWQPIYYLTVLSNCLASALNQEDTAAVEALLPKIHPEHAFYRNLAPLAKAKAYWHYWNVKLYYHYIKQDYALGLQAYDMELTARSQYKIGLSRFLALRLAFVQGLLCFALGNYTEALQHWQVFLHKPLPEQQIYQNHVLLGHLLLLWETAEPNNLQHHWRRYRRWLKQQAQWDAFTQSLFRFIYRSFTYPHRRKQTLRLWSQELEAQRQVYFNPAIRARFYGLWLKRLGLSTSLA